MLEIFALPYIAISGVIGWLIFGQFFRSNDSDSLSRGNITTGDLLAIALPIGVLFSSARWVIPVEILSPLVQAIMVMLTLLFAATALVVALFLVPKRFPVTSIKRMTVVGVIAPFGILLTVGWIGFLIWACTYSISYLAPSSIAIAAATSGLRMLSFWVCQAEPEPVEPATNPPA